MVKTSVRRGEREDVCQLAMCVHNKGGRTSIIKKDLKKIWAPEKQN
jgi:hypothetical protein